MIFWICYNKKLPRTKIIFTNQNYSFEYFLALSSLNSSYFSTKIVCFNPKINPRLLGILRTIFTIANYSVSYLFYPRRIFRSMKNIFSSHQHETVTVFEHRLRDLIQRKMAAWTRLEKTLSLKNQMIRHKWNRFNTNFNICGISIFCQFEKNRDTLEITFSTLESPLNLFLDSLKERDFPPKSIHKSSNFF